MPCFGPDPGVRLGPRDSADRLLRAGLPTTTLARNSNVGIGDEEIAAGLLGGFEGSGLVAKPV